MGVLRGITRFAVCALALASSGRASGQLLIAAPTGEAGSVEHAELAQAWGDGPPVTWLSLRTSGAVAVVAALPAGAAIDGAPDAWFEALEATASPRVLLPDGAVDCENGSGFVPVAWPRSRSLAPAELLLETPQDVLAALAAQGLELAVALPVAPRYALWSWPASRSPQSTRTLRVVGGATPLTLLPGSRFPVLASALTRGFMKYPAEGDGSDLRITVVSGPKSRSDYFAQVRSWLDASAEPLLEARSRGLIFDWSIASDRVTVSPLLRTYARRAAAELDDVDAEDCSDALVATRAEPSSSAHEACGSARDATLALQAATPEHATLQRFIVRGEDGVHPELLIGGGSAKAPVLRAAYLDGSACPAATPPPTVVDVNGGTGETVAGETVVEEHHHEAGCSGGAYVEPDESGEGSSNGAYSDDADCSSDSASSSDSDADCSSDSASSSDSDADCSSDSASSSDSDADCSSDSASSSDSDADCSSDSSGSSDSSSGCDGGPGSDETETTGYDGDTCAGSAATPPTESARQALRGKRPKKPQRLRLSSWSLAWAAFVLPFRRRRRGP